MIRRRTEPLIHEILEESRSEEEDSYSSGESKEAPVLEVVVNENDPKHIYRNET